MRRYKKNTKGILQLLHLSLLLAQLELLLFLLALCELINHHAVPSHKLEKPIHGIPSSHTILGYHTDWELLQLQELPAFWKKESQKVKNEIG